MTDTVAWQSMLNQVREERDALAAELAECRKNNFDAAVLILEKRALEAALRKIVRDGDYTAPEGMKRIAQEALGSELEAASETRIEAMKAINTGLEAVCRRYEAALKDISIWQNDLTSARAVAIWALGSQTETACDYGCTGCRSTPCICATLKGDAV